MSAYFRSGRMLLPDHREAGDVFRLADAVEAEKVEEITHPIENGITREITWKVLSGLLLQYAEDARSGSVFIVVAGTSPEKVQKYADRFAAFLECPSLPELIAAVGAARSETERARAVLRTGIAATEAAVDPAVLGLLEELAGSGEYSVRIAAVTATRYAFWPEFQPLLERVSRTADDPDLRQEARRLWEASVEMYGPQPGGST